MAQASESVHMPEKKMKQVKVSIIINIQSNPVSQQQGGGRSPAIFSLDHDLKVAREYVEKQCVPQT